MNYVSTTMPDGQGGFCFDHSSIYARWLEFHQANPRVYQLFERFTMEATRRRDHYSANAIFERMRWHTDIETVGDEFKMNNDYRAYYARYFMARNPKLKGFFRTRKVK